MFHFFKAASDTSSSFLVVKLISANGKRDSGTRFTSLKFASYLPKPRTDWFANANGIQPTLVS